MPALPSGNVTFLFTDLEQSTQSWEADPSSMESALARHDEVIRAIVEVRGGYVFSTGGDGFGVAFDRAQHAVDAAAEVQSALGRESWPGGLVLRTRIGLHTGNAREREANYFGPTVNRAARVMDAAHGGQVLVSDSTAGSVAGDRLVDLGRHWLKDLPTPERLWELVCDPAVKFPPPRTLGSGTASNVPHLDESLLGRSGDVDSVKELLAAHRLVTVVGVGGIGKTRLALDVARSRIGTFEDGVWWCELAPIGEPEAVAHAVGQILGARQHPGRSMVESVAEFCRRREVLLVLDNCEHVLDAAGELVEALSAIAPRASVLATSREALGCSGEQAYPLRSLESEGEGSPAFELFARRAAQAAPGRQWRADERAAIDRICRRLDGMPLAIELAAGRVRSLSPAEIEERLGHAFRVLRGGRRSVERHRTLSAAIDWSYQLLDEVTAIFFERLSIFAGGWDLRAAEEVCSDGEQIDDVDVAALLDDLVSKSLVVAEHGVRRSTRYRLLEPLRQYAEDRLASGKDIEKLRDAHAAYYCRWAEQWDERSWADELAWRIAIETEFANLRTAIAWAIDSGNVDVALRTVAALDRVQAPFLLLEIGDWARRAVEMPGAMEHRCAPDVCRTGSGSFWWRGDLTTMLELIERGERADFYEETALHTNQLRALFHVLQDQHEAAMAVLERVDLDDPVACVVPWFRSIMWPEPRPSDIRVLRSFEAKTGSTIVGILADQAEAWCFAWAGDLARAGELQRRAIARADELGARYFVHLSVAALWETAAAGDRLTPDDLELVRRSLCEQRDTGQEVDQWLVLMTAAAAMLQHHRQSLAEDIYRALRTSPWATSPTFHLYAKLFFGAVKANGDDAPPRGLASLVDAVLDGLRTILRDDAGTGGER